MNEGPGKFCIASEIVIDLAQENEDNENWNPHEIQSPHWHEIPPIEQMYKESKQIGKAMPLLFLIQPREIFIDGFIDDIMTVVLDGDIT